MDSIIGLPKLKGKGSIFVVAIRLAKYAYFGGIQSTYTINQVLEVFMK